MMDDGTAVLLVKPPVVLTVLKEANEPGFPSLSGYVTALDADVVMETAESLGIAAADTGLKGSPTRVAKVSVPEISRKRCLVKGDLGECAERLLEEIKL
jgi:electron transfer flavoprotein beta subunit